MKPAEYFLKIEEKLNKLEYITDEELKDLLTFYQNLRVYFQQDKILRFHFALKANDAETMILRRIEK